MLKPDQPTLQALVLPAQFAKQASTPCTCAGSFNPCLCEQRMATVRQNQLCLNCLKSGHFKLQCPSNERCPRCQGPHHSILHQAPDSAMWTKIALINKDRAKKQPPSTVAVDASIHHSHLVNQSRHQQVLLMTSRILIVTPDGYVMQEEPC